MADIDIRNSIAIVDRAGLPPAPSRLRRFGTWAANAWYELRKSKTGLVGFVIESPLYWGRHFVIGAR